MAGGRGPGDALDQLDRPSGVALGSDECLYVADYGNDRVMRWRLGEGEVVAGGRGWGDDLDQMAGPMGIVLEEVNGLAILVAENCFQICTHCFY